MNIYILGAGSWGFALATAFCRERRVTLWTIDAAEAKLIKRAREIKALPGIKLDKGVTVEPKYATVLQADDILVVAVPSRKIREVAQEMKEQGLDGKIVVNVSKGVEAETLKTISEIMLEILPSIRFANLSGPTIALEVAQGLPAKAILASKDLDLLFLLADKLTNPVLKLEFSRDPEGIELCASLKGLIAIGVGLADGLNFKSNVFGLIMTYGLREFTTVMEFLGVNAATVYSIAGLGDLITTCLSENSRNRRFGKLLGEGVGLDEALHLVGMEVEGVSMAKTVRKLAQFNLSIPFISFIARVIFEDIKDIRTELTETLNKISG